MTKQYSLLVSWEKDGNNNVSFAQGSVTTNRVILSSSGQYPTNKYTPGVFPKSFQSAINLVSIF